MDLLPHLTPISKLHLPILPTEIIYLNIFSEFLSSIHVTSKLNISFNYTKYLKKLAPYYTILLFFTILKSLHLKDQPVCLEEDFSLKKKLPHTQKPSLQDSYQYIIYKSNNEDHKSLLESNKFGLFKAPT